jgi:hypothetical protein
VLVASHKKRKNCIIGMLRAKGMRISTVRVLQESKRIAQEDNIKDFKTYPSWVFGFMKRNNLSVRFSTSVGQNMPFDWEAKVVKFSNVYCACSFFTNLDLFCIDNVRVIYKKIR